MIKLCTHVLVYIEDKKKTKIIDEILQKVKNVMYINKTGENGRDLLPRSGSCFKSMLY